MPGSWNMQIWIQPTSWLITKIVEPRDFLPEAKLPSLKNIPRGLPKDQIDELKKAIKRMPKGGDREPVEFESFTTYQAAFDVQIPPHEMVFTPPDGEV